MAILAHEGKRCVSGQNTGWHWCLEKDWTCTCSCKIKPRITSANLERPSDVFYSVCSPESIPKDIEIRFRTRVSNLRTVLCFDLIPYQTSRLRPQSTAHIQISSHMKSAPTTSTKPNPGSAFPTRQDKLWPWHSYFPSWKPQLHSTNARNCPFCSSVRNPWTPGQRPNGHSHTPPFTASTCRFNLHSHNMVHADSTSHWHRQHSLTRARLRS